MSHDDRSATDPRLARAIALMKTGDHNKAEPILRELYRNGTASPDVAYPLGVIEVSHGNMGAAKTLLEATLARAPNHANAHFYLGRIAQQSADRARAEAHFKEALRLNPSHRAAAAQLTKLEQAPAPGSRAPKPLPFEANVPASDEELDQFKHRLIAKKRALFWVDWHSTPLPLRVLQCALALMVFGGVAFVWTNLFIEHGKVKDQSEQRQVEFDRQAEENRRKFEAAKKESAEKFEAAKKESAEKFEATKKESAEKFEAAKKENHEWFERRTAQTTKKFGSIW